MKNNKAEIFISDFLESLKPTLQNFQKIRNKWFNHLSFNSQIGCEPDTIDGNLINKRLYIVTKVPHLLSNTINLLRKNIKIIYKEHNNDRLSIKNIKY